MGGGEGRACLAWRLQSLFRLKGKEGEQGRRELGGCGVDPQHPQGPGAGGSAPSWGSSAGSWQRSTTPGSSCFLLRQPSMEQLKLTPRRQWRTCDCHTCDCHEEAQ